GHLGHVRMAGQYPFDRCGAEVFAVDPQPVAEPPREIGVAGLVPIGEISTVIPAAGHPLLVGFGVVVVALETPCAGDVYQLADDAGRTRLPGVDIDDLDLVRQWTQRSRRGVGGAADGNTALGRPEAVDDPAVEPCGEAFDVRGRTLVAVDRAQRVVGVVRPFRRGEHVRQRLADVVRVSRAV